MYDLNKLIAMTCDILDNEKHLKEYTKHLCNEFVQKEIWIPGLRSSTAYRLGELVERSSEGYRRLYDVCDILNIDEESLISLVKSMRRWERRHKEYDLVFRNWNDQKDRIHEFLRSKKVVI